MEGSGVAPARRAYERRHITKPLIPCQGCEGGGISEDLEFKPGALSARIRNALKGTRLGQAELAEIANVDQGTVSNWMTGKTWPRIHEIARLMPALKVSGHWLLTGEGKKEDLLEPDHPDLVKARHETLEFVIQDLQWLLEDWKRNTSPTPDPAALDAAELVEMTDPPKPQRQERAPSRRRRTGP